MGSSDYISWLLKAGETLHRNTVHVGLKYYFIDWLHSFLNGLTSDSGREFIERYKWPGGNSNSSAMQDGNNAFIFGCLSHLLEIDDSEFIGESHPSGVLFSSVLNNTQVTTTLDQLFKAVHLGYLVFFSLGKHLNPSHYENGWHGTGTIGPIAGAVANSFLLEPDLDTSFLESSFINATQFSGGFHGLFGTPSKCLSSGRSAMAGIISCFGPANAGEVFENRSGFFEMYNSNYKSFDLELLKGLSIDNLWFVKVKSYPSCHCTHSVINSIKELKETGLFFEKEGQIDVFVSPYSYKIANLQEPQNLSESFFSIKFCTAIACYYNDINLDNFNDALNSQEIQYFLKRIRVHEKSDLEKLESIVRVSSGGHTKEKRNIITRGNEAYSLKETVAIKEKS